MLEGNGDLTGLKFTLVNAMKDLRYYTHLAESLPVPCIVGEARAPEPRHRQPAGLRRQVRGVADRGAGEARRRRDRSAQIAGAKRLRVPGAHRVAWAAPIRHEAPRSRRHALPRPAPGRRRARARPRRDDLHARRPAGAVGRARSRISSATATRASRPDWRRSSTGEWDAAIDIERLRPALRRRIGRRARRTRRALHVRVVALRVRGREPARARRNDAGRRRSTIPRPRTSSAHYGALKARCEDEVRAAFGRRALVVRPGLIVGPHRPDRSLRLLGRAVRVSRGSRREAARRSCRRRRIAPSSSSTRAISRSWMLDMAEHARTTARSTRAAPAGTWTMGALVDALVAAARAAGSATVAAVDRRRRAASPRASRRGPSCRCGFPRPTPSRRASWSSPARGRQREASRSSAAETIDDTAAWLRERDTPPRGATCFPRRRNARCRRRRHAAKRGAVGEPAAR